MNPHVFTGEEIVDLLAALDARLKARRVSGDFPRTGSTPAPVPGCPHFPPVLWTHPTPRDCGCPRPTMAS